jgi:dihydroorotate dehydrogenase electron transfer subunit
MSANPFMTQSPMTQSPFSQLPVPARIVAVEDENYRTKTFTLDARLDAAPGQFVMVWLPRFDEKPFSLVNANPVTLMISAVGPFTRLVHQLGVGDRLWLRGPFGRGFSPAAGIRRPALIGGGYGVAPLLWFAQQHVDWMDATAAIIGARTAADLLYTGRFGAIADHQPSLSLYTTTEDGTGGVKGRVTDVLEPLLQSQEVDGIFACGPHGMLAALESLARSYGVEAQLSWEAYMRCGIGICGACEHDGKVLCLDGPVLSVAL